MALLANTGNVGLSTANGFYKCINGILSDVSTTILGIGTTPIYVTVTSNQVTTGNCKGVVLWLYNASDVNDRDMTITQQNSKGTCTLSIASPCVVTSTGHGFTGNEPIVFSTTGTLPTGITAGTIYYVKYINANTFNISATPGGANINTSGTQSGTQTLWFVAANQTFTASEITTATYKTFAPIVDFWFTTPGVIPGASAIRFGISRSGGTTGSWYLRTVDGTTPTYAAISDTTQSFAYNDSIICTNKGVTTVDMTTQINGWTVVGDLVNSVAIAICSNKTDQSENGALLQWSNAGAYTLSVGGHISMRGYGMMRMGTAASPLINVGTLRFLATSPGSAAPKIWGGNSSVTYHKIGFFAFGKIPSRPYATLSANANVGATSITVNEDVSTWANGDKIYIGRCDTQGQGDLTEYTISSVVGNTVNFSPAIAGFNRISGGKVINSSGYGVIIKSDAAAGVSMDTWNATHFQMSGCYIQRVSFSNALTVAYNTNDDKRTKHFVRDCCAYSDATGTYALIVNCLVPPKGIDIERVYGMRMFPYYTGYAYAASSWKSGTLKCSDTITLCAQVGGINTQATNPFVSILERNVVEGVRNSGYAAIFMNGINITFNNNEVWGSASSSTNGGAIQISSVINPLSISGNKINKSAVGLFVGGYTTINCKDVGFKFGDIAANTEDIYFAGSGYNDYWMETPTGISTINKTLITDNQTGSEFRITNFNNSTYDDRIYMATGNLQRCGTGLADTTKRDANGAPYSWRFEPNSTNLLSQTYTLPIGNCQNKNVTVIAYLGIKNSAYFVGSHTLPKVTVDFDNGTIIEAVMTNTKTLDADGQNGWILVPVPFSPTTTYPQIKVTISGGTDAVGSNAYFYLSDIITFGPTFDMTSFNYWAGAKPAQPIATLLSGSSLEDAIWNAKLSDHTTSGSAGKKLTDGLTTDEFIGLSE